MKLTVEENPREIQHYGHLRPAPPWSGARCGARCGGTPRTCTLRQGHVGLHAAHGILGRVLAVWEGDRDMRDAPARTRGPVRQGRVGVRRSGTPATPPSKASRRLVPNIHDVESWILLLMTLSMAAFGLEWVIRVVRGVT